MTDISKVQADPNRVAELMAAEMESSAEDMANDIGTLFYGTGAGDDFMGLEAIVDDGTNMATYGTLARATYTTLKSTVTASGGTLTLRKMATLFNAISSGSIRPTLGLCTETVFSFYEELLQAQEQIVKSPILADSKNLIGGTGFTGLIYKGIPILADEKATSGVLYFINENFLEWRALPMAMTKPIPYGIEIEGNDYTQVKGLGFSTTDWIMPENSPSIVRHIYLGGELWGSNPKRSGKLTAITGV